MTWALVLPRAIHSPVGSPLTAASLKLTSRLSSTISTRAPRTSLPPGGHLVPTSPTSLTTCGQIPTKRSPGPRSSPIAHGARNTLSPQSRSRDTHRCSRNLLCSSSRRTRCTSLSTTTRTSSLLPNRPASPMMAPSRALLALPATPRALGLILGASPRVPKAPRLACTTQCSLRILLVSPI